MKKVIADPSLVRNDFFGVPGERSFYRVKVPNPPGSGKG